MVELEAARAHGPGRGEAHGRGERRPVVPPWRENALRHGVGLGEMRGTMIYGEGDS